ncbi:MAG TPA: NIPSNAP family protein [Mucilaginibacter sp.]|jgi:hypothetical protein|nr:NIPSNAP family protein [Mucilaginibacter sp.]
MYIVRDTMFLKFGHFRDAKALMGTALQDGFMPETVNGRILSDFTGHAYRFILERSFHSLAEYEQSLQTVMSDPKWQSWYELFRTHVERSEREILREVSFG